MLLLLYPGVSLYHKIQSNKYFQKKMKRLTLFREIIADCYDSHKEYANRMCRRNAEVFVCFSRGYALLTLGFKRLNTQAEQSHLPRCIRLNNVNLFYLKTL